MASNVVDPVEAVGGVKKSSPTVGPHSVPILKTKNDGVGSCNYILAVMKYTNIAMQHQSQIVALRGELATVVTKMQGDMATISQFISKMQSMSHAGGFYGSEPWSGSDDHRHWSTDANGLNGLSTDYYKFEEGGANIGRDDQGVGDSADVSSAYAGSMQGFIAAVKDLFYSSPAAAGSSGVKVSDLTSITNPYDSKKPFDMNSLWTKLQPAFAKYNLGDATHKVISTTGTDSPSLLQQYMYYQAQLTVNTSSKDAVTAASASTDGISALVNFDPTSTSNNLDSNIGPVMGMLDALNTTVTANRNVSIGPDHESNADSSTTRNILSMILTGDHGDLYTSKIAGDSYGDDGTGQTNAYWQNADGNGRAYTGERVGLYGAFAYMAFNYAWTKNPNGSMNDTSKIACPSVSGERHWYGTGSDLGSGSLANGDPLSTLYSTTNTAQTNFSASGNQTNTSFQQDVNAVQQIDGAAGKMVDGYGQSQSTSVRNFKQQ